jgi:hypothetical protein
METASDLIISADLGLIEAGHSDILLDQAYDLAVRISNFSASQLRRASGS